MLNERVNTFLGATRLGVLSHRIAPSGWGRPVPVWFDWDGDAARVFSGSSSPKMRHLRHDPVAHLLVANQVGEPEAWVSLTANVEFGSVDPSWLEALAARYWVLDDADQRAVVDGWLASLDELVLLTLRPTELRHYGL
jgi:hypothetical protein